MLQFDRETMNRLEAGLGRAVREAGALLKDFDRTSLALQRKTGFDIVTEADLAAEAHLRRQLQIAAPEIMFVSEESALPSVESETPQWIVDPLDGTVNFTAGLPLYAVCAALRHRGETLLGSICAPELGLNFSVSQAGGARCGEVPARVADRSQLDDAVIAVSVTSNGSTEIRRRSLELVAALSEKCRGVRILTTTAVELGLVASGRLDAFICLGADAFSTLAGCELVRAAGGKISAWPDDADGRTIAPIIASSAAIHDKVLAVADPFVSECYRSSSKIG